MSDINLFCPQEGRMLHKGSGKHLHFTCYCSAWILWESTDIKFILSPEWSRRIALGIAEGICEIFGGTVKEENKEAIKVMWAKSFDENLAGTYVTITADLKLRAGANSKYEVLDSIPKNAKVKCYGYYTEESDGTVWLYVVYNGQTGFVSKRYLK